MSDNFPSDQVVSEDTGNGGGGPISSPIWQPPPPLRPPLGLLPVPNWAGVKGVSSAHHEEVGGLLADRAAIVGSLRTHDPSAMQAGAFKEDMRRACLTINCGTSDDTNEGIWDLMSILIANGLFKIHIAR